MLILAIDTTNEKGGVGIFRGTECLASVPNAGTANEFSVTLFEMVEQVLAQAHLKLPEIEVFAAANGPGSFTGIRIGLAAALAWGKVFHRRVHGVSVLEAMVSGARPTSDWAFPLFDARRGEFYLGSFHKTPFIGASGTGPETDRHSALEGGVPASDALAAVAPDYVPAGGGWVLNPQLLRGFMEERLAGGATGACVVRAHDQAAADLRASLPAQLSWQQVDGSLLDSIARVALREEQSNSVGPDAKLDACYIRRPDAENNWKA